MAWDINDLERWDACIRERAEAYGLRCFPQDFEICDHEQMLGYIAYSGMPSHYPHWSYGKSYEKLRTLYDHGVSGIPYEMVINTNPALAYLMRDNSLTLQILTMAHVYGHNDFFKNNAFFAEKQAETARAQGRSFSGVKPEEVIGKMKTRANYVRDLIKDPSVGFERVEAILDAAHGLSLNMKRNPSMRDLSFEETRAYVVEKLFPPEDRFRRVHKQEELDEKKIKEAKENVPFLPEENFLLFIRNHNPYLTTWERHLLTIAYEESQYFIPQIETKIMNEGWASFWHWMILNDLLNRNPDSILKQRYDLQALYLEFVVRHNQVVCPLPRIINPYNLGFHGLWKPLYLLYGGEFMTAEDENLLVALEEEDRQDPFLPKDRFLPDGTRKPWQKKLREVCEEHRDMSCLRLYLFEELGRRLNLFAYGPQGDEYVVTHVLDENRANWRTIKETLIKNVGMNVVPYITVEPISYETHVKEIHLKHHFEGDERELDKEYAEKTMRYFYDLMGRRQEIVLHTFLGGKPTVYRVNQSL